jgi:Predicted HD superfamily hydrolase
MKLTSAEKAYFFTCIKNLLDSEQVRQMDSYMQHGHTSCLQHSIAVSYYSYALCRRFDLTCDESGLIRAALLHDFFLYDWHDRKKGHKWHGFKHPGTALSNAEHYFKLSDLERDIIAKHMWPLTLRIPKYKESLIVCLIDKYCSIFEIVAPLFGNNYNGILLYCRGKVGASV